MRRNVFSIIAATAYGNRGAEAMLETVVGRLREEEASIHFHAFSYYPADDRRLIRDSSLNIHSSTPLALVGWLLPWSLLFGLLRLLLGRRILRYAPEAIKALGESTALVDLAGVAFIDGREKFLLFNSLTLLPAWLLGTPIVKMPQATGPFRKPLNRWVASIMLPKCRMIWARGARTREHLAGSGFAKLRFRQADDIAFNHQDRYSLTEENTGELDVRLQALRAEASSGARGIVGLCPSSVVAVKAAQEGGTYEAVLAGLVRELAGRGYRVALFPNATRDRDGEAQRNNDLPLIRRVLAAALADGPLAVAPVAFDFDLNAKGIKQIIAASDVVLVSRFHAMVGALSLGVPPAVLGWSHKYAEVMARFGLESAVMDYQRLSGSELLAQVEDLFERRMEVRDAIRACLPEVKASAELPILQLLQPSLGADLA